MFPPGKSIAEFHVYTVEWEPGEIRWFVDEHQYAKQDFWWSSGKLAGMFNDAIAAIREDGTYDEVQKKYFEFDVYGE